MLRVVNVRFDHFLDGPRRVAQVAIARKVHGAHSSAADASHDFVAAIQRRSGIELFCFGVFTGAFAGTHGVRHWRDRISVTQKIAGRGTVLR